MLLSTITRRKKIKKLIVIALSHKKQNSLV